MPVPRMWQQRNRDRELALLVPPILQLPRVGRRLVHPVEVRIGQSPCHRSRPAKPSEFGQVAFGVALPHVHRQIGDPRACSASCASGPGPSARPVRVIASSTAVSTTALVRRAINSARPPRFSGSASTWPAADSSVASAAVSAASTAPRCASVCGSTDSRAASLVQRCGDGARPSEPAGAHPDGAVPEPRPIEVLARGADGYRGRTGEFHGSGVGVRHPRIAPIAGKRLAPGGRRGRRRTGRDVRRRLAPSRARACRCPHPNTTPWCRPASPRRRHPVHARPRRLTRLPRHPTTDRV